MRIHTKFNGYEAGRRLYFKGGGGGGQVKYDNLEALYAEQANSARLLRGIAEQNLPGATQAYVGEVQNVLAPDYANRQASRAGADMAGANAMERAATERNLASMGVNPNDPRFAGSLRSTQLNNAARMAAGKNIARNEADQFQLNVAKDAVGTFTGQSNNAATQMGNAASGLGSVYSSQANQKMAQDQQQSSAVGNAVAGGLMAYSMFKDGGKVVERHMVGGQAGSQQNQGFFQMQSIAPPPTAQAPQQQGGGVGMTDLMMAKKVADKRAANAAADAAGSAFAKDVATNSAGMAAQNAGLVGDAAVAGGSASAGAGLSSMAGAEAAGGLASATNGALMSTGIDAAATGALSGSITSGAAATGAGTLAGGASTLAGGAGTAGAAAGAGAMGAIGAALPWVGAAYAVGSLLDWWADGGEVGTQNAGMSEEEAMRRFSQAFNGGDVEDMRDGRKVPGEWAGNTDNVPAMLTEKEFVLNAEATALADEKALESLNAKGLALREAGYTPNDIKRGVGLRAQKKVAE